MSTLETSATYAVGDDRWRVRVEYDDSPESPREWEQGALLITWDSRYHSPDKVSELPAILSRPVDHWREYVQRGDVNATAVQRWARAYASGEILAVAGLSREHHDGTLLLDARPDVGGRYDGLAIVTRESWTRAMGEDYTGENTPLDTLQAEVREYNVWARGEVYGYVTERQCTCCHTWTHDDSCWGMMDLDDGVAYAMREGIAALPDGAVEVDDDDAQEG